MQPSFEVALEAALQGGARLIQLREKDLLGQELETLARRAQELCRRYEANLIINNSPQVARTVGAVGVHFSENKIAQWESEAPADPGIEIPGGNACGQAASWTRRDSAPLIGFSAHSLDAVRNAEKASADYLVFGSIFKTPSHSDETPQGLAMLRSVTAATTLPVYAIGGITPERAALCRAAGAHGVAVIGAVWLAPDIASAVADFNAQLGE